jgi:hypothetical protein
MMAAAGGNEGMSVRKTLRDLKAKRIAPLFFILAALMNNPADGSPADSREQFVQYAASAEEVGALHELARMVQYARSEGVFSCRLRDGAFVLQGVGAGGEIFLRSSKLMQLYRALNSPEEFARLFARPATVYFSSVRQGAAPFDGRLLILVRCLDAQCADEQFLVFTAD